MKIAALENYSQDIKRKQDIIEKLEKQVVTFITKPEDLETEVFEVELIQSTMVLWLESLVKYEIFIEKYKTNHFQAHL